MVAEYQRGLPEAIPSDLPDDVHSVEIHCEPSSELWDSQMDWGKVGDDVEAWLSSPQCLILPKTPGHKERLDAKQVRHGELVVDGKILARVPREDALDDVNALALDFSIVNGPQEARLDHPRRCLHKARQTPEGNSGLSRSSSDGASTCSTASASSNGSVSTPKAEMKCVACGGVGSIASGQICETCSGKGFRRRRKQDSLVSVPVYVHAFSIRRAASRCLGAEFHDWRCWYTLRDQQLLGEGASARVFEAEAHTAKLEPPSLPGAGKFTLMSGMFGMLGSCGQCHIAKKKSETEQRRKGRLVAIKKYKRPGTDTFQKELAALLCAGVHPNILRLLESFESDNGEDVLVLEHCDGLTVFKMWARNRRHGLPEGLIVDLMRQLLLALRHLHSAGIEHRDVKPENMMLYDVSYTGARAKLKLGDFGWAEVLRSDDGEALTTVTGSSGDCAGTLEYAAPELNPPVWDAPVERSLPRPLGSSDLWSTGVVTYLLLVGNNPFHASRNSGDKVCNLVAHGHYDEKSPLWLCLCQEMKDFVASLLKVDPTKRLSAAEALNHAWFKDVNKLEATQLPKLVFEPNSQMLDRQLIWNAFDGLQQLGWFAVARALAENDLERQVISAALHGVKKVSKGSEEASTYLLSLAKELGTSSIDRWLQKTSTWNEIFPLAFRYLDVDCDGVLSSDDLAAHTTTATSRTTDNKNVTASWVSKWRGQLDDGVASFETKDVGLSISDLSAALVANQPGKRAKNEYRQVGRSSAPQLCEVYRL